MATPEGRTKDGFETQFGINHLGHFLLFQLVKVALLASSTSEFSSRVISVSSSAHRAGPVRFDDINFEKEPYNMWSAYGQSKTANIYFANEIERRYGSQGLHALSLHPGTIETRLGRYLPPEPPRKEGTLPEYWEFYKSPEQGAATTVYAAIGKEWEGVGGKFLSNCVVQGTQAEQGGPEVIGNDGTADWAFDEEAAKRLWMESLKMVGMPAEE
jgi:NAD(P)-dependent dehydrogenase (short-subunit alcohol dehydrogenase family)